MRVFVSYRRDDSSAWAGRLRDALAVRFGEDGVFQDVAAVRPGDTFTDEIDAALVQCDVTLVVIGPRWISVAGAEGVPRLADPNDYVRREVHAALTHGKVVIPVLVGGAVMPTTDQLPIELQELAVRNAIALRDETWHLDVDRLIGGLDHEPSPTRRNHWLLATGLAIGLIAAGTAGWILLDDSPVNDDSSNAPGSSNTASAGVSTTFNPYTAAVPTCPTPVPPAWTDFGTDDDAADENRDAASAWRFTFLGGGYQSEPPDEWDVVIRTQATSLEPATSGGLTHYPFYKLVIDGEAFDPYCFQVVSGNAAVGPDESNEALVGFHVTRDPAGALSIDIDDTGSRYRIDLLLGTDS